MKKTRDVEGWTWWLFAGALIAFFAWLRGLAICEFDLFWQIRAGQEILQTHHVQTVDAWSFIAKGHPWYNFEWLSCVVDYLVNRLAPQYIGLFYFRIFLTAACLLVQVWIIRRLAGRGIGSWMALITLLPALFTMMFSRFQMRPDLFATEFFLLLLATWLTDWKVLTKKIVGLGLLLLWSNFHGGTIPFGVLVYSALVLTSAEPVKGDGVLGWLKERTGDLLWIFVAACTWVATPIGIHVYDVIRDNVLNYDYEKVKNPDFAPFTLKMFRQNTYWFFAVWPPYTLLGAYAYAWMIRHRPEELPPLYRRWPWITAALLVLSWLGFRKIRCLQYQALFLFPVLVVWVSSWCKRSTRAAVLLSLNATAVICGFYIPYFLNMTAGMRVDHITDWEVPVKSVEFIKKTRPAQNLLNGYNFGGYLIAELPEYPVFVDSREVPFLKYLADYREAIRRPATFQKFLDDLSISTALVPYPGYRRDPKLGLIDANVINYPQEKWALVYFDNVSIVFLRRNPQNDPIIRKYEYQFIRPGVPFYYPANEADLSPEVKEGWEKDADRCIADNPENAFCLLVKSSFVERRGDIEAAKTYCAAARRGNPENNDAIEQWKSLEASSP